MLVIGKGALGAAISIAIGVAAKSRYFFIAGLLPLFPAFALIAHWSVGQERGIAGLKTCIVFTILALIPYLAYLTSLLLCIDHHPIGRSLLIASGVWLVTAIVLVIGWQVCGLSSGRIPS